MLYHFISVFWLGALNIHINIYTTYTDLVLISSLLYYFLSLIIPIYLPNTIFVLLMPTGVFVYTMVTVLTATFIATN